MPNLANFDTETTIVVSNRYHAQAVTDNLINYTTRSSQIPTPPAFKAQETFNAKMAEAKAIHEQLQPKKATPPFPQKPQSFIKRNKKALIWGGIGASTLAMAGITWHFLKGKNNSPVTIDEFANDELA